MIVPSKLTLERPLTLSELSDLTDEGAKYLEVVVRIDLDDLINHDMDWLNDKVNELVLPVEWVVGLMDYGYNVVGHEPGTAPKSYGNGTVLLHVSADAGDVINEMYED